MPLINLTQGSRSQTNALPFISIWLDSSLCTTACFSIVLLLDHALEWDDNDCVLTKSDIMEVLHRTSHHVEGEMHLLASREEIDALIQRMPNDYKDDVNYGKERR